MIEYKLGTSGSDYQGRSFSINSTVITSELNPEG